VVSIDEGVNVVDLVPVVYEPPVVRFLNVSPLVILPPVYILYDWPVAILGDVNSITLLPEIPDGTENDIIGDVFESVIVMREFAVTEAVYLTIGCVHTLVVGLEVLPAMAKMVPPVILNVLLSQSNPHSGELAPIATIRPPFIVIVPLESIASLFEALQ